MHIFLCCPLANFNTSHVSINRCLYYGARRLGEISIHLMFLLIQPVPSLWHLDYHFNTSHVSINHGCKLRKWRIENNFNTSHVSINPAAHAGRGCRSRYFNTSHVSINLWPRKNAFGWWIYFNTSHVSINPSCKIRSMAFHFISIHLMFLLIAISSTT